MSSPSSSVPGLSTSLCQEKFVKFTLFSLFKVKNLLITCN